MVGNWVFFANTASRNDHTREISAGPAMQNVQCFANIESSPKAVRASMAEVVPVRVIVPNLARKDVLLNVVAKEFRGIDPASTTTGTSLAAPEYLVEIEIAACRGASAAQMEHVRVGL